MKNRQRYADNLAADAAELVSMVRDEDPQVVGQHLAGLTRTRVEHLVIALAAMCPDDRTVGELLAWCDPNHDRRRKAAAKAKLKRDAQVVRHLAPHGTHAAFNRHRAAGQTPCDDCVLGERVYQRERSRRRRAS